MYHMESTSIRDLRYNFPRIRRMLRQGKSIEVTERGQVIGRLEPVGAAGSEWPDFEARWKAQFGDRKLDPSGADLLKDERERY